MSLNEADTCRIYVNPKLQKTGWEDQPHSLSEQYYFTDGRVSVIGGKSKRGDRRFAYATNGHECTLKQR